MTVNGGTFNGGFRVQGGTTMTIAGGEFNDCYGSGYNIYGTAVVKGGTFTDDTAKAFATKYVSEDCTLGEEGKVVSVVAKIGEIKYETLDAAVAAASEEYRNGPAFDFDYKENIFFQEDVGDAIKIYDKYYQKLKVDTGE
jgi:hypothetical protein